MLADRMLLVGGAATCPARMLMALRRPSSGTPSHTSGGELAQTNWTAAFCIETGWTIETHRIRTARWK